MQAVAIVGIDLIMRNVRVDQVNQWRFVAFHRHAIRAENVERDKVQRPPVHLRVDRPFDQFVAALVVNAIDALAVLAVFVEV